MNTKTLILLVGVGVLAYVFWQQSNAASPTASSTGAGAGSAAQGQTRYTAGQINPAIGWDITNPNNY